MKVSCTEIQTWCFWLFATAGIGGGWHWGLISARSRYSLSTEQGRVRNRHKQEGSSGSLWKLSFPLFVQWLESKVIRDYKDRGGRTRRLEERGEGRCYPLSKRGESDWTTEMMDDTAASNTHLSSGIINLKQDDQYTSRILPQLCYAGQGAAITEGQRWI